MLLRRNPFIVLLAGLLVGLIPSVSSGGWWLSALLFIVSGLLYLFLLRRGYSVAGAIAAGPFYHLCFFVSAVGLGVLTSNIHRCGEVAHEEEVRNASGMVEQMVPFRNSTMHIVHVSVFTDAAGVVVERPHNYRIALRCSDKFSVGSHLIFPFSTHVEEHSEDLRRRSFDTFLRSHGAERQCWLRSEEIVVTGRTTTLRSLADECRLWISDRLDGSRLHPKVSAMVKALVLGERSDIDEVDMAYFRKAGLSHLMALSGLHIGIVFGILTFLTIPLVLCAGPCWRWGVALAATWMFVYFTGWQVAAVRACVMISFMVGAWMMQRRRSSLNALLGAAFFILLFEPAQLVTAGFQLSFVIAGMLLLGLDVKIIDRQKHPLIEKVATAVIISLTAMAGSLALTAYHFHNLPVASFMPNLLAAQLMQLYMPMALIYVALLCVGVDVILLRRLLESGYEILANLAQSEVASASVPADIWISGWVPVLSVSALGLTLWWLSREQRWCAWASVGCLVAMVGVIILMPGRRPEDCLQVRGGVNQCEVVVYSRGEYVKLNNPSKEYGGWEINGLRVIYNMGKKPVAVPCRYLLLGDNGNIAGIEKAQEVVMLPSLNDDARIHAAELCRQRHIPCHDMIVPGMSLEISLAASDIERKKD